MKMINYKIIFLSILILIFNGCSLFNTTYVVDTTIKPIERYVYKSDSSTVVLEWKPRFNDDRIIGYNIYKSKDTSDVLKLVKTIKNKYQSHYIDKNLKPDSYYSYAVSAFDANNKESKIKFKLNTQTKPRIKSIVYATAISGLPKMIKILWRIHENLSINSYIIERKSGDDWKKIATVKNRLSVEYIDKNLGDGDTQYYRVIAIDNNGVEAYPSRIVKGVTSKIRYKFTLKLDSRVDSNFLSWTNKSNKFIQKKYIYRGTKKNGKYKRYKTLGGGVTSWIDITDSPNKYYYYIIYENSQGVTSYRSNIVTANGDLDQNIKILYKKVVGNRLIFKLDQAIFLGGKKVYLEVISEDRGVNSKKSYLLKWSPENFSYILKNSYRYTFKLYYKTGDRFESEHKTLIKI